jgi:hypothetical protein
VLTLLQVYREVKSGSDVNCFAKTILENKDKYGMTGDEATFLAGAMYGAGSDTVSSPQSTLPTHLLTPLQTADMISTAIMTFTKYPALVARAQAELDTVVGRDRLPDFADEADLVYCSALVREIMRWRTVIAGGLAHASIKDDFYEGESHTRICGLFADAFFAGYHIPAGPSTSIPSSTPTLKHATLIDSSETASSSEPHNRTAATTHTASDDESALVCELNSRFQPPANPSSRHVHSRPIHVHHLYASPLGIHIHGRPIPSDRYRFLLRRVQLASSAFQDRD